jgi:hypothetical protein
VVLNHSNASHKDLQTLYLIFDKNLKSQQQTKSREERICELEGKSFEIYQSNEKEKKIQPLRYLGHH